MPLLQQYHRPAAVLPRHAQVFKQCLDLPARIPWLLGGEKEQRFRQVKINGNQHRRRHRACGQVTKAPTKPGTAHAVKKPVIIAPSGHPACISPT